MNPIYTHISKNPVFYITRDIERALGIHPEMDDFFIISNYTEFAKSLAKKYKNILLVENDEKLDTWQLLERDDVVEYICKNKKDTANILVFKTTKQIERICEKNSWKLLNTNAELADTIEQKISQIEWAEKNNINHLFPKYQVMTCKDVEWKNEKMILQFNHSHTGSGTMLIESKKQIEELKEKFPDRPCRMAQYIYGPLFTSNIVIWDTEILLGNISYQITGLKPFTDTVFATIGNDWSLPHSILNEKQINQFNNIAKEVGEKMKENNWKGIFGIDVVLDEKENKMYLLEINARQPASTSFESILQQPKEDKKNITIFSAYINSVLDKRYDGEELVKITDGAQIIIRNTDTKLDIKNIQNQLNKLGMNSIKYGNTTPNSDQLRIQSNNGIMKDHNTFNEYGKKILEILQ